MKEKNEVMPNEVSNTTEPCGTGQVSEAKDVQSVLLPPRIRRVIQGLYDYLSDDVFRDRFGILCGSIAEIALGSLLGEVGRWLDSLPPNSNNPDEEQVQSEAKTASSIEDDSEWPDDEE